MDDNYVPSLPRATGRHRVFPDALSPWKLACVGVDLALVAAHAVLGGLPFLAYERLRGLDYDAVVSRPIVVLIHGTGVTEWQWGMAKLYLFLAGIPYHCVNYDYHQSVVTSFRKVKADITTKLVEAYRHRGSLAGGAAREIVLIGHSQGGVIARLLYNHFRRAPEEGVVVRRTFLLHAPQKGAYICNVRNRVFKFLGAGPPVPSLCDLETDSRFTAHYNQFCDDDDDSVYECSGRGDYVDPKYAFLRCHPGRKYLSWFGHYFPAVNLLLWWKFIIANIPRQLAATSRSQR